MILRIERTDGSTITVDAPYEIDAEVTKPGIGSAFLRVFWWDQEPGDSEPDRLFWIFPMDTIREWSIVSGSDYDDLGTHDEKGPADGH